MSGLVEGFQRGYEATQGGSQQSSSGDTQGQESSGQSPFLATLRGSDPKSWQTSAEQQTSSVGQSSSGYGQQSQQSGLGQGSTSGGYGGQSGGQTGQGSTSDYGGQESRFSEQQSGYGQQTGYGKQQQSGGYGQQSTGSWGEQSSERGYQTQPQQQQSGGYGQQSSGSWGQQSSERGYQTQPQQQQSGYGEQQQQQPWSQQSGGYGQQTSGGYGQQQFGGRGYEQRQQQPQSQYEYVATPQQQQGQYGQQAQQQQFRQESRAKNIVVFGGTGSQGRSIVNELLDSKQWNIRVLCKDTSQECCREWSRQGVDMVECDWNDLRGVESCLDGSYACFLNINYWESNMREKEEELAIKIMQLARRAGVQHLIYSALPHVESITQGNLKVQHFSTKGKAMKESKQMGFKYLTHLLPSFYYSNWFVFFPPRLEQDGGLTWIIPGRGNQFSSYDAYEDTGRCVKCILENPQEYNQKHVCLEGDCLKVHHVMDQIANATGRKVKCLFMDYDKYAELRGEGGHENAEMFQWFDNYGYFGPEYESRNCVRWNKSKDSQMKTFNEWLQTGVWRDLLNKFANIRL